MHVILQEFGNLIKGIDKERILFQKNLGEY